MAGRIVEADLEAVRERARIDEIVGTFVALRNAGSGQLKGLCPFHDEKTPSFNVNVTRGFYHCFGCDKGGDVISFVQEINNMSFVEAVEWLADKVGIQLRYEESGGGTRVEPGLRQRVLEANRVAEEFFREALLSPDALVARQFLAGRGFDQQAAEHFGCGFAPTSGKALRQHLSARGFSREEQIKACLVRESGWDFFQGRLLWPIRDSGSGTLGFGARRILDDDRMPAKYINTPETVLYKKSHVLYGLDLARKNIGKKSQAVVVEGYTDVMACHLAGVDTAVASCGTAFGADHGRLLQRLMTADAHRGEVIFTFDGDAAGQAAALKVFKEDETFTAQTYVAVEPGGMDPCDLRLQAGDAAVRELVARRVPLYRFVMQNIVDSYDLDRVEGRLAAVRDAAPLVSSVRDAARVSGYLRELAGMVGMSDAEVRAEAKRALRRRPEPEQAFPAVEAEPTPQAQMMLIPDPRDRRIEVERGILKLMVQEPSCFDENWNQVTPDDFRHPTYCRLFKVIQATPDRGQGWGHRLVEGMNDPQAEQFVSSLAVEPLLSEPSQRYVEEYSARLRSLTVGREIDSLKSRLQRTNPEADPETYNRMFGTLLELEARRRDLQAEAIGDF